MRCPPRPRTAPTTRLLRGTAAALCLIAAEQAPAQTAAQCGPDVPAVLRLSTCSLHAAQAAPAPSPSSASLPGAPRPARKTLAELLRERDGNDARPRERAEWQPDGARVLKARMGAG